MINVYSNRCTLGIHLCKYTGKVNTGMLFKSDSVFGVAQRAKTYPLLFFYLEDLLEQIYLVRSTSNPYMSIVVGALEKLWFL